MAASKPGGDRAGLGMLTNSARVTVRQTIIGSDRERGGRGQTGEVGVGPGFRFFPSGVRPGEVGVSNQKPGLNPTPGEVWINIINCCSFKEPDINSLVSIYQI